MKKLLVFLYAMFFVISVAGNAQAVTIDFEELSYGQDVAYDLYESDGIIFDSAIDWEIYSSTSYPKALLNNTNWAGDLIASFTFLVSEVSVLMGDNGGDFDTGTLKAYDICGTEIASYAGSGYSWFTVSVEENTIASFRIFATGNVVYDEIIFEADPIPEPATMLLLGSGLVGLAGFRRKKFKK